MAELARAISEGVPPPLAALRPDADPALMAVIERAMARDPGWRFGSADEMRAGLSGPAGPPVRPATRVLAAPLPDPTTMVVPPPHNRRSRWYIGVAAAVIAVLVAAIAFIVDSASTPSTPEPASTSTSVPAPTPSFVPPPPPPTTTPVQVEEPPPPKKRGGNGNGHKKGD
jgi:serine/threonine-protein kinase